MKLQFSTSQRTSALKFMPHEVGLKFQQPITTLIRIWTLRSKTWTWTSYQCLECQRCLQSSIRHHISTTKSQRVNQIISRQNWSSSEMSLRNRRRQSLHWDKELRIWICRKKESKGSRRQKILRKRPIISVRTCTLALSQIRLPESLTNWFRSRIEATQLVINME